MTLSTTFRSTARTVYVLAQEDMVEGGILSVAIVPLVPLPIAAGVMVWAGVLVGPVPLLMAVLVGCGEPAVAVGVGVDVPDPGIGVEVATSGTKMDDPTTNAELSKVKQFAFRIDSVVVRNATAKLSTVSPSTGV